MKQTFKLLYLGIIILLISSCKKVELFNDFIKLSLTSYTFYADGTDSTSFIINSEKEWNAEPADSWVKIRINEDTVFVKLDPNNTPDTRFSSVKIKSGSVKEEFIVEQLNANTSYQLVNETGSGAISRNGRFYAYLKSVGGKNEGKIFDYQTGEVKDLPFFEFKPGQIYDEIKAISDDGKTLIYYEGKNSVAKLVKEGKIVELTAPSGEYIEPMLQCMSADGNIIIGYCKKSKDIYSFQPVKWVNETAEILEIPSDATTIGGKAIKSVIPRSCSDDASVIDAHIRDNNSHAYWKDGIFHNIAFETNEIQTIKMGDREVKQNNYLYKDAAFNSVSHNGKFIASKFTYYTYKEGDRKPMPNGYAAIINTSDNTIKVFRDIPSAGVRSVLDDGTGFGTTPFMAYTEALVFDYNTGANQTMSEWSQEKLGIHLENNRSITNSSKDMSLIIGDRFLERPKPGYSIWYLVR